MSCYSFRMKILKCTYSVLFSFILPHCKVLQNMQQVIILTILAAAVQAADTTFDIGSIISLAQQLGTVALDDTTINTDELNSIAAQFTNPAYLSALSAEAAGFNGDLTSLYNQYSSLYATLGGTSWLQLYSQELSALQEANSAFVTFLSDPLVVTTPISVTGGQSVSNPVSSPTDTGAGSASQAQSTDNSGLGSGSAAASSRSGSTAGSGSAASSGSAAGSGSGSSSRVSSAGSSSAAPSSSSSKGGVNVVMAPLVGVFGALAAALI